MWKSFENIGLQTSEKVSWEKKKKETCAKNKIDRSQNGRSNKQRPIWHKIMLIYVWSYANGSLSLFTQ